VADLLAPVRERYRELRADPAAIEAALRQGADRARGLAEPTMAEVHDVMGLGPRG
jgi:tryptophanyl-tRNA synthetase